MDVKWTTYWRKNKTVASCRVTEYNIKELSDLVDGEFYSEGEDPAHISMHFQTDEVSVHIGDWVVLSDPDDILFFTDEQFLNEYYTLPEALCESDKLAAVHKIVMDSMHSARFGNEYSESMETTAMHAAKEILQL